MVSKKILGVAIAAAFSTQAFAALDLTAGTGGVGTGALKIAKESLLTGTGNNQVDGGMIKLVHATNLDTTVALGFGVSAGSHAFVRFNLTNGKFTTALTAADLTLGSGVVTTNWIVQVAQGGGVGDDYVIFDVTAVTAQTQAQTLILDLAGLSVSATSPLTISYAHYSTSPSAVAQTGSLATDSYAAVSVAEAIKTTFVATNQEADVSASPAFKNFVSSGTQTASIGSITIEPDAGFVDAAGVSITALAQLMDITAGKSQLVVTGDLSFIASAAGATAAADVAPRLTFGAVNADVGTPATNTASTGKTTTLGAVTTARSIGLTATSAINAGSYSLTFTPAKISGGEYTPTAKSGALGSITRTGTTIQVPYLTTFADYNQRLVLVNRSSLAAPYAVTFTKEAGVTATAGAAATGTLAANETKIIKATDLVTLTGGSRTAATVTVTAPTTSVDAATTTVNLSDKSTDTVKLQ